MVVKENPDRKKFFRNLIVLTSSLRRERKLALFFNAFLGTLLCNNAMVAQMEQNSYEKSIHVYLHINVVSEIYVWQKYLRVEKKCILKVYASQKLCLYFQKYMKTKPGLQVFFICVI